jgi:hypothetical protein
MANAECSSRVLEGVIRGTNFRIQGIEEIDNIGLVQQFQLQFQRALTRIYDLASPAFYYIEGPSEGRVAFANVIGPRGAPRLNCDCTPRTILLNTGNVVCYPTTTSFSAAYSLKNALPFGLTLSGDSNKFVIIGGISYMFNDIEYVE